MKILVINGPNINMLGIREPGIYGKDNFNTLCETVKGYAMENGIEVKLFQSNHEGALVDEIQAAYGVFDGIVINPGAYTHTSIALLDAVKAVSIPTVEVHLSEIQDRESFRHISVTQEVCIGQISGMGFASYQAGLKRISEFLQKTVEKFHRIR